MGTVGEYRMGTVGEYRMGTVGEYRMGTVGSTAWEPWGVPHGNRWVPHGNRWEYRMGTEAIPKKRLHNTLKVQAKRRRHQSP